MATGTVPKAIISNSTELLKSLPFTINLPSDVTLIPPRSGHSSIKADPNTNNSDIAWKCLQQDTKQSVQVVTPIDSKTNPPAGHTRFVCISDTHSLTDQLKVPNGDVLIHAGDFSDVGRPVDIKKFNSFLGSLPHKYKIVIAGNHDVSFDTEEYKKALYKRFGHQKAYDSNELKSSLVNAIYLEDYGCNVLGFKIYGSPWQPWFYDWGFNLARGQTILDKWNMIPDSVDILITHGPPIGHGDLTSDRMHVGCVELLSTIQHRVKPKYHIFGHIHEAYGVTTDNTTTYINASTCTIRYQPKNLPIVFDLPTPTT